MSKKNFKLILLGDIQVGKSSIVLRFVQDKFRKKHETTVGAAYLHRDLLLPSGETIHLELWDTAGQERYKALAPLYFRGSHAAVVVYDVTKSSSFEKGKTWFQELKAHQDADPEIVFALVGNKVDIPEEQREVDAVEAQNFAGENDMLFFETSAKEGINVKELFIALGNKLEKKAGRTNNSVVDQSTKKSSSCC